jgi:hypothetical protein
VPLTAEAPPLADLAQTDGPVPAAAATAELPVPWAGQRATELDCRLATVVPPESREGAAEISAALWCPTAGALLARAAAEVALAARVAARLASLRARVPGAAVLPVPVSPPTGSLVSVRSRS